MSHAQCRKALDRGSLAAHLNHRVRRLALVAALAVSPCLVGMDAFAHEAVAACAPPAAQVGQHDGIGGFGAQGLPSAKVQVLFVDLQPELISSSKSILPQEIAANAAVLAKVAKLLDVPVTFSLVPIQGVPGRHIPELAPYSSTANTIRRIKAGTFMEPGLVNALASHHRNILVVSGYVTEVAVLQSVLAAIQAGYTVYVPVDAIGSPSRRTEEAVMQQMIMAGAIPTSVWALAAQLAPDFSKAPGSELLKASSELRPPQ